MCGYCAIVRSLSNAAAHEHVRVGTRDQWQFIHPTTKWQWMQTPLSKDQFQVATDLYYIDVNLQ